MIASMAEYVAPFDPYFLDVMVMLEGPSGALMGTDEWVEMYSVEYFGAQVVAGWSLQF